MIDATDKHDGDELAYRMGKWRWWLDALGFGVVLASVAVIVGGVVRVFDPDLTAGFTAYGGWDRIRVLTNTTAQPTMLVAAAVALLLVLALRLVFRWPAETPSGMAKAAVAGSILVAVWLMVVRGLAVVAETFANETGSFGAITGFEQFERVMAAVGTWLGSAVVVYVGVRGFALLRSPSGERRPGETTVSGRGVSG